MTADTKPRRFLRIHDVERKIGLTAPKTPTDTPTCGAQEAAKLLCISESTLLRRVRTGIVPGAKIGRRLVFVRDDLLKLVRNNYKTPCSIDVSALRSGGFVSSSTAAKSASQLAHEIALKRKNSRPKLEIVRGGKQGSARSQ